MRNTTFWKDAVQCPTKKGLALSSKCKKCPINMQIQRRVKSYLNHKLVDKSLEMNVILH